MKRALIAVASVGILASTAWVVAANAQANINPNVYPGNTSGQYGAQGGRGNGTRVPARINEAGCASPTPISIAVTATKRHAQPLRLRLPLNGPPAAELAKRPANSPNPPMRVPETPPLGIRAGFSF
jgi:hypothetical protein